MGDYRTGSIFGDVYRGKSVLVTGDTGFKGSWLSIWLHLLGANVVGYSSYLPSRPSLFSVCKINKFIEHIKGDVRDQRSLGVVFKKYKPEFIFHLAAQPIVNRAYVDPKFTFETNVLGSVNIMECLRKYSSGSKAIIITSDKCYRNMEWDREYHEADELGGNDPYSSSKACAELACHAYYKSFFSKPNKHCRIVTARAGNVIGGGDWAVDRLVPDCVRAWSKGETVYIRYPKAIRPWQHVLEPLSGYLWLGVNIHESDKLNGESFNFGPNHKVKESVSDLIRSFSEYFSNNNKWAYLKKKKEVSENMLLRISSKKASRLLDWRAILSFPDTIKIAAKWYEMYYRSKNSNMLDFTKTQIEYYVSEAKRHNLLWAKD